jgi:hypothetical protein
MNRKQFLKNVSMVVVGIAVTPSIVLSEKQHLALDTNDNKVLLMERIRNLMLKLERETKGHNFIILSSISDL